jgi:DNA-binding GntR family transcriptional regulator
MASPQQSDFERILDILEFKILSNALKPRERLIERELMEAYGINKGTVRKILKELTVKNLIKHMSNRGAVVTEPTPEEVEDIYHTRVLLESYAIEFVVANMNSTTLKKIEDYEIAFEKSLKEDYIRGIFQYNRKFHQAIFGVCGNKIVSEMIDQLRNRSRIWFHYIRSSPLHRKNSVNDHLAMIECLRHKDAVKLKSLNKSHLTVGFKAYKKHMIIL